MTVAIAAIYVSIAVGTALAVGLDLWRQYRRDQRLGIVKTGITPPVVVFSALGAAAFWPLWVMAGLVLIARDIWEQTS